MSVKDRGPCHDVTVASVDGEKASINGGKLHQCGGLLQAGACLLHLEPCEKGDCLACVHSFTEHLLNTHFMRGPIPVMGMQQRARWPNAYI